MSDSRVPAPRDRPSMGALRRFKSHEVLPAELQAPTPSYMMELLGLAVFQEAGEWHEARLWAGHTDPKLSDHDRWLYTTLPGIHDGWLPCARLESHCEEAFYTYPVQPYEDMLELLHSMETVRKDLRDYFTQGKPDHTIAWLVAQKLTLGFTDPYHIAQLPLGIDWSLVHDFTAHREAWFERNPEFREMPLELTLRMHGLGSLAPTGGS